MAQGSSSKMIQEGVRELIDISFTNAFLIMVVLAVFLVFGINNLVFNFIDSLLAFLGIEYAKQLLFFIALVGMGVIATFLTRDNDLLSASIIVAIAYYLLDFFFLLNNFPEFSLLA